MSRNAECVIKTLQKGTATTILTAASDIGKVLLKIEERGAWREKKLTRYSTCE